MADNYVSAIAIDSEGNKWFGTGRGVSKFDVTTWTTYTTEDGLASNYVEAIAIDQEGNKWFGTDGGLSMLVAEEQPEPTGPVCDFNGDGKKLINDVIAYLIYAKEHPEDLARLDWNGDGKYAINDAIMFLIHLTQGTCPDLPVELAGVTDGIQAVKMEGLSQADIEYIEQMMALMDLTEEQEAAFRLALYGQANASALPKAMTLAQNAPNPFNPATTIGFSVPQATSVQVSLEVYDLRGRLVRVLVDEMRQAGTYTVFWDGTDQSGAGVSSGVYLYRMKAGDFVQTRKMVLLK